jgi:hypothetical protein
MILYLEYICYKAGISSENYHLFVSGDDVYILMERPYVQAFETAFYTVFSKEEEGTHGLGQCCKFLTIHKNQFEFLGRLGKFTPL